MVKASELALGDRAREQQRRHGLRNREGRSRAGPRAPVAVPLASDSAVAHDHERERAALREVAGQGRSVWLSRERGHHGLATLAFAPCHRDIGGRQPRGALPRVVVGVRVAVNDHAHHVRQIAARPRDDEAASQHWGDPAQVGPLGTPSESVPGCGSRISRRRSATGASCQRRSHHARQPKSIPALTSRADET